MDERELRAKLSDLPLGEIRYFDTIGSTNDEALAWATQAARDLSLVVADEQTAGRGRAGRKWLTPRGTALAISLILRPTPAESKFPARITGLGALALTQACRGNGLPAEIKWPNDVLINSRKAAGILVESVWSGEKLEACVLGMGVNVLAGSVPPESQAIFPATSLEGELKHPLARPDLIHEILSNLIEWRAGLGSDGFLAAWEQALAYRGRQVQVWEGNHAPITGDLIGLEADGSLDLRLAGGSLQRIHFGEIHLRPAI